MLLTSLIAWNLVNLTGLALGIDGGLVGQRIRRLQSSVDVVFQIDESDSMSDEQNSVKSQVTSMFSKLDTETNGAFRVGLVGFGRAADDGKPIMLGELTNDTSQFLSALDALKVDGTTEPGLHAIKLTADDNLDGGSLGIAGAFCAVIISDEDSDWLNITDVNDAISAMNSADGIQFAIGNNEALTHYEDVASATGGDSFDLNSFMGDSEGVLNALLGTCVTIIAQIIVTPTSHIRPVGTVHTVTAIVSDTSPAPIEDEEVTFEVTSGPNAGACAPCCNGCSTDEDGEVFFSYTGNGGMGIDTIEVCVNIVTPPCRTVEVEWVNSPPVAVCENITVGAQQNCEACPALGESSFDPEGDSFSISLDPPCWYGLGTTDVTVTVEDALGRTDSCTSSVTVVDSEDLNANDQCSHAESIEVGDYKEGSTVCATEDGIGACGTASSSEATGVWYVIEGTGYYLRVTTCYRDTTFDTQLSIFVGECDELSCVDGNDDDNDDDATCRGFESTIDWVTEKGRDYYILVSGAGQEVGNFGISVESLGPLNDHCTDAERVYIGEEKDGSTIWATDDDVEDVLSCGSARVGSQGVWYWVEGNGNILRASTCFQVTDFDTQIAVFKGTCDRLECVHGNDDADDSFSCSRGNRDEHSSVTWRSMDDDYYILVYGRFGRSGSIGDFRLVVEEIVLEEIVVKAIESECNYAQRIREGQSKSGSTVFATVQSVDACGSASAPGAPGVWFVFEGTGHFVQVTTCSSRTNFDTQISVFTGGCNRLTCATGSDNDSTCSSFASSVAWVAGSDKTYYILVHGDGDEVGEFVISIEKLGPPNDICTDAERVEIGEEKDGSTMWAISDGIGACTFYDTGENIVEVVEETCNTGSIPVIESYVLGFNGDIRNVSDSITLSQTFLSVFNSLREESCLPLIEEVTLERFASSTEIIFEITFQQTGTGSLFADVDVSRFLQSYNNIIFDGSFAFAAKYVRSSSEMSGFVCEEPTRFTEFVFADLQDRPDLLTAQEILALENAFEATYNSLTFQLCDSFFRRIIEVNLLPAYYQRSSTSNVRRELADSQVWETWPFQFQKQPFDLLSVYVVVFECRNCPSTSLGSFALFDDAVRRSLSYSRPHIQPGIPGRNLQRNEAGVCSCAANTQPSSPQAPSEDVFFENYNDAVEELVEDGTLVNVFRVNQVEEDRPLCDSALTRAVDSLREEGSTIFATVETGSGPCGSPGVWYEVQGDGRFLQASTCSDATDLKAQVSVFMGGCNRLTCVDGTDDLDACHSLSSVSWQSVPGEDYHILVRGLSGDTGLFDITVKVVELPNDECRNAEPIEQGQYKEGSTIPATVDFVSSCENASAPGAPGVWYVLEGTGDVVRATTCNFYTRYDTQISVFTGECDGLSCVVGNDNDDTCDGPQSSVTWNAESGLTYYILIHGAGNGVGAFEVSIEKLKEPIGDFEVSITKLEEPNDLCGQAERLQIGQDKNGSTLRATIDASIDPCGTEDTGPGVWYIVEGSGQFLRAQTCSDETNYDTQLSVFTGTCSNLICVTGNDDAPTTTDCSLPLRSSVTWEANLGDNYYILVHGYSGATGIFRIFLEATGPPNDECNNAECGNGNLKQVPSNVEDTQEECKCPCGTGGEKVLIRLFGDFTNRCLTRDQAYALTTIVPIATCVDDC